MPATTPVPFQHRTALHAHHQECKRWRWTVAAAALSGLTDPAAVRRAWREGTLQWVAGQADAAERHPRVAIFRVN